MPPKSSSVWSEWDDASRLAYIIRQRKRGYSWRDMAEELGVRHSTVYNWAKRNYPFVTGDYKTSILSEAARLGLIKVNKQYEELKKRFENALEKLEMEEFEGVPRPPPINANNNNKNGSNDDINNESEKNNDVHDEPNMKEAIQDFRSFFEMKQALRLFWSWFNDLDRLLDDYSLNRVIRRFYEIALNKPYDKTTERERMLIIKFFERVLRS